MQLVRQPEGSNLCGQACVAMIAGITLQAARDLIYVDEDGGTHTKHLIKALRASGVECDDKLKRVSRKRPMLPARCIVAIHGPVCKSYKRTRWHWMVSWDGVIYDPDGCWPELYKDWRVTSYLEIKV